MSATATATHMTHDARLLRRLIEDRVFRTIVEQAGDAIAFVDAQGLVVYRNRAAVEMFGYKGESQGQRQLTEVVAPEDRPRAAAAFKDLLKGNTEKLSIRIRLLRFDRSIFIADVTGTVHRTPGGPMHVVFTGRDVTNEVDQYRRVVEDENRFRTLVDSFEDIVFQLDLTGRHTGVYGRWLEHMGIDTKFFIGRTAEEILGREKSLVHEQAFQRALLGKPVTYEWTTDGPDGVRTIQTTLSPIFDDTGVIISFLGVGRDITESVSRSEDLRLMSVALEHTQASVVMTDVNGAIQYVNPGFKEVTGYGLEEVLGKNSRILQSGLTPRDVYASMWKALTAGQTWSGEFCNRKKSGELYWESAMVAPISMQNGSATHYVAVKQDITQQKKAEIEAAESHRRFQRAFASSPIAMVLSTLEDGRVIEANEAALRILGFDHPELNGRTTIDAAIWPGGTSRNKIMRLVSEQGSVRDVVLNVRRIDGEEVELIASFERMEMSGEDSVLIHLVDMTEQRRAKMSLQRSEEQLRRLFEESPAGIVVVDCDGFVESCNDAFAKMVGCTGRYDLQGQDLRTFQATEGVVEEWLSRTVRQTLIQNEEFSLCRRDGKPVHVQANVVGRFDDQGTWLGLQAYCIDESLQKTLERQLIQAQKMESLGTLAGGIAHDFNNVLGIIFAHLSLLPLTVGQLDKFQSAIEAMSKASERGAGLVRQLMTFARMSEPARELVRVSDVVDEISGLLKETFPKVITFVCDFDGVSPVINADPTQMHQILLNLCVNARDAMIPGGGTLRVRMRSWSGQEMTRRLPDATGGDYAEIEVADTGCGMDETVIPRIFDPFYSTKPKGRGTGLGLSTVYGIVKAHHGFIDVESEVGKGTTFHLFLPSTPLPGTNMESAPQKVMVPHGQETILLVDDEETLREAFRAVLESRGFRVLTASDGEQAVHIFREHAASVNVVVTDFGLPRRLGSDVVAEIKTIDPEMKTIVLTGYLDADQRNQLRELKVDAIIMKPTKPDIVARKIRSILDAD